ncbi:28091_t:CDS:1 [Gigaspora margarita]|uniref:28091_t:CDS:1 n=1 Tax=Gigaspora margarita TaxID=4874 RepID=A0ABN7V7F2_GIGMA|nr:28091_t:CDS:1 [Gigaspora margarita]
MFSLTHAKCDNIGGPCSMFSTIFSSVPLLAAKGTLPSDTQDGFAAIHVETTIEEKTTYNTKIDYILQSGDYFASTQYWVRTIGTYVVNQTDNIGFPNRNLSYGHVNSCYNFTVILSEDDTKKIHACKFHLNV